MSTRTILSTIGRLAVIAGCVVATASCGSEMLRTGRAPVYLVISGISPQGVLSDVEVLIDQTVNGVTVQVPSVANDNATVSIRAELKNPSVTGTAINAVTLTRYRVVFRRTDGRSTPGVDVPYGFDGGLGLTIQAGGTGAAQFEIVRHQSKLEPPLKNLSGLGGQALISTIAEITFFGHDQNGNEVSVTGRLDVHFGDFPDQ